MRLKVPWDGCTPLGAAGVRALQKLCVLQNPDAMEITTLQEFKVAETLCTEGAC